MFFQQAAAQQRMHAQQRRPRRPATEEERCEELEHVLSQALQAGGGKAIEPGLANTLLREARSAVELQEQQGLPTVLLVPGQIRDLLARFLKRTLPQLKVLSQDEIPGFKTVRVTATVGGR